MSNDTGPGRPLVSRQDQPAEIMPKEIATAILSVMSEVTHVEKKGRNEFHRYDFARVEDLLAKVQPAMVKAGLVIVQSEVENEYVLGQDGTPFVLAVTYEFLLAHKDGVQWATGARHTGMAGCRNSKGGFDDKAFNKCMTAARKYFLLSLFQIPAGDLPDAEADDHAAPPDQPAKSQRAKKADTPPPEREIDRSGATVPEPEGEGQEAWTKWRKAVATMMNRAKTVEEVRDIEKRHGAAIIRCDKILPGSADKLIEFAKEREATLSGADPKTGEVIDGAENGG